MMNRTTMTLLADSSGSNRGELGWRIGMVFAGVNFVLLALAISSVNPRVGRSGNLLFALFSFVLYYNLLNLGESWVSSGRFGIVGFLITLHGGVMVAALVWLAKRDNNWLRRHIRAAAPSKAPTRAA